jgi:hypothetical protein
VLIWNLAPVGLLLTGKPEDAASASKKLNKMRGVPNHILSQQIGTRFQMIENAQ